MEIAKVGIVGAGTMGSGIAINLAQHGIEVSLFDRAPEAVERARDIARAFFRRRIDKGQISEEEAAAALERIRPASALESLATSDLVIEAVFEDFDLKADLFRTLSDLLPVTTRVATNTSCLRVSDLQKHMREPGRFLGLHYFSPAQINPVVEVVRGEQTSREVVDEALDFCRATDKQPLLCKDSYGFAINRFFCPYTNEAARALDEGLGTTAQIDRVAGNVLGAAAGPFFVMNLIKPRINLHAIRNLAPLGPFYAPAKSMIEHGEADRSFEIGEATPLSPEQEQAIADRLLRGTFLPVLQALDEEVAAPADFDRGARLALRFGNPPCALMDRLGRQEVARILAPALDRYGVAMPRSFERIGTLVSR